MGFAAIQYLSCASDEILVSELSLANLADCLVRIASGWSAIHPIILSDDENMQTSWMEWIETEPFAVLFDIYMKYYIKNTMPYELARKFSIQTLFHWNIPSGNYPAFVDLLEPIEPNLRNVMHIETGSPIVFRGYKLLPSLPSWVASSKSILIDVGINRFMASPKALLDMYDPWLKFNQVILIEPQPNKSR